MLREPGPLLSRLLMPLVAVVVFEPLYRAAMAGGRAAGAGQAVTGMLVLFSLLALSIVGTSILTERSWHTWDRLLWPPLPWPAGGSTGAGAGPRCSDPDRVALPRCATASVTNDHRG
ncbi:MAG TPA: hypothetical protein VFX16_21540 [Pseudonocardiaceae bacterium]|nr:hypothetical protein [Pseudonocardiaceae bacterium]